MPSRFADFTKGTKPSEYSRGRPHALAVFASW